MDEDAVGAVIAEPIKLSLDEPAAELVIAATRMPSTVETLAEAILASAACRRALSHLPLFSTRSSNFLCRSHAATLARSVRLYGLLGPASGMSSHILRLCRPSFLVPWFSLLFGLTFPHKLLSCLHARGVPLYIAIPCR